MNKMVINGGNKLYGEYTLQSAKNSVLPLISSVILYNNEVKLKNVKKISDVITMCELFKGLGGKYRFEGDDLILNPCDIYQNELNENLCKTIRSSFFMTGALLSKFKNAKMIFPGGCNIGLRPIDAHIDGLIQLGVDVKFENQYINFYSKKIVGKKICLSFPSVGATENLIMASVFCEGFVRICNVAKEPEIIDLQNLLNLFGCKVKGAGTSEIFIEGVKKLNNNKIEYSPFGDRIECGTILLATACCGGEVQINNININNILYLYKKILQNNCKITINNDKINIISNNRGKGLNFIQTNPFPYFPTDLQAPLCAYAGILKGRSIIKENLFENRFGHIPELVKMGLKAKIIKNKVIIDGVKLYHGARVFVTDLRAGASLIIAGLSAEGKTEIVNTSLIDRGYYQIEEKLKNLGANISREG